MRTADVEAGIFRIVIVSLSRLRRSDPRRRVIRDLNRLRALWLSIKRERLERNSLDGLRRVNGFARVPGLRAGFVHKRQAQKDCEKEKTKHASGEKLLSGQLFVRQRSVPSSHPLLQGRAILNERKHLYENSP